MPSRKWVVGKNPSSPRELGGRRGRNPTPGHCQTLERRDVDLLIMASHGYSGVERLLLGSLTEKVLHQVEIPMLVVGPSRESGRYEPFVEKPLRTILVAIDLGPATAPSMEHASVIAKHYGSKLQAVHVMSPLAEALGGPLWPAAPELIRASHEAKTMRADERQKLFGPAVGRGFETETLIWEGDPAETLLHLAAERDADLVVMGAHGHGGTAFGWLRSTCNKVIRATPCPVLAVRKRKNA